MNKTTFQKTVNDYLQLKGIPVSPAGTFDDFALKNLISDIESRSDIQHLEANLSKDFKLNIPIVSANMDTVTDAKFAITLARHGGLGFIHQFFSIDERVHEVIKVKRADNSVVDEPLTIEPSATLAKALELMNEFQVSSLLVTDAEKTLVGIITSRDTRFVTDTKTLVSKIMTPAPLVTAPANIKIEKAIEILISNKVEKLPLVDSKNHVVGLITAKDILKKKSFPHASRDKRGRLTVGATLRLNGDYLDEAAKLLKADCDVLLLDTARGGSTRVAKATTEIKRKFPNCVLVVGNVDTPEEVEYLAKAGADCIKVGIGPGAACKTREETGVGIPQLYAVTTCVAIAKKLGVYIIADGGIKSGGNLAKALAAGANAVMIGGLFAGTDEAPGHLFRKGNQLWKAFRGSASFEHQVDRMKAGSLSSIRNPEGEAGLMPYAGSLSSVLDSLLGGLRSSMSYLGARTLTEFCQKSTFIWVTQNGRNEGRPQI